MDDTPEMIRQQMEETKSQLSEKLETLELQVAETVQSTGTAINATAEAVQETVETVSEAVQDAVHSVGDSLDIRTHLHKHPWLILAGAAVVGYVAARHLTSANRTPTIAPQASPIADGDRNAVAESLVAAESLAAAYESGRERSAWDQMKLMALSTLVGVLQDVAIRAVPRMMGVFSNNRQLRQKRRSNFVSKVRGFPRRNVPDESEHRLHIAAGESFRPHKSR